VGRANGKNHFLELWGCIYNKWGDISPPFRLLDIPHDSLTSPWLFRFYWWLLDFQFTLNFLYYWKLHNYIHKLCGTWGLIWHLELTSWHDMNWQWWHGLNDDVEMSSHSSCCYPFVFLRDGSCPLSSSFISHEDSSPSYSCSIVSFIFQLHRCLLAWSPSSSAPSSSFHDRI